MARIIKINLFFLLILNSPLVFGQTNELAIKPSESGVPVAWKDSLIAKKWMKAGVSVIKNKKIKETRIEADNSISYLFQKDSVAVSPYQFVKLLAPNNDTVKNLAIIYFPLEKSFYMSAQPEQVSGNPYVHSFPYHIIYLKGDTLILEAIDVLHYDFQNGKISSDEEAKQRDEEYAKTHGQAIFRGNKIGSSSQRNNIHIWQIFKTQ